MPIIPAKCLTVSNNNFCYHCDQRKGLDRGTQKYKYFCKNCNRWFLENKKLPSCLPLGDDVWHANELGLRVNKHEDTSKIIFVNI